MSDNYGNIYDYALENEYGNNKSGEYILNMKYSRIKGTIYVAKGNRSEKSGYITITADGKTIYTSPTITKSSAPVDFDVSVRGCNDLKINWVDEGLGIHIGNL